MHFFLICVQYLNKIYIKLLKKNGRKSMKRIDILLKQHYVFHQQPVKNKRMKISIYNKKNINTIIQ